MSINDISAKTAEDRRQKSEETRRMALRRRVDLQRERQRQISRDIANIDVKPSKRIKFDDSDNDEDNSEGIRTQLFDSNDDDEEEVDINIDNRHTGKTGEKLMRMESRFNSDPRFKLSEKFIESNDDDNDGVKDEMKEEREKNKELLSRILGKSVGDDDLKIKNTKALARPFSRFDPMNEEHLKWMEQLTEKKTINENYNKKENEDEDDQEEDQEDEQDEEDSNEQEYVKADTFYEINKDELNNITQEDGFSFLKMIGRTHSELKERKEAEYKGKTEEASDRDIKPVKNLKRVMNSITYRRFFIDANDQQVRSMAANFCRTQNLQKIIDKWTPHRDAFFKLWKKQKRNVRRLEKEKGIFGENNKKKDNKVV